MSLTKHGHGQVLRDDDAKKTAAAKDWTPEDDKALEKENRDADSER